jgi:hypothetical protein
MRRCRRVFNPRAYQREILNRRYQKALEEFRDMTLRNRHVDAMSSPVEIIERPSMAFPQEARHGSKSAFSDICLDPEIIQDWFKEWDLPCSSSAYKERKGKDVAEPQMAFDLVSMIQSVFSDAFGINSATGAAEEMFDNISENVDKLTGAALENSRNIQDLIENLSQAFETGDVIANNFGNSFASNLANRFSQAVTDHVNVQLMPTLSLLILLVWVMFYRSHPSSKNLVVLCMALIFALYVNRDAVFQFAHYCGSFLPSFGCEPQAGQDFDSLVNGIAMLLFTLNMKGSSFKNLPKNITDHLKAYKGIKDSLKDIVVFLMKLLEMILDYSNLAEYMPAWAKFLNVTDPEVKDLFERLDSVNRQYVNNALPLTKSNGALLQDLHRRVLFFLRTLPQNPSTAVIRDSLKSEIPKISKMIEVFRAAKLTDDGKRIEPVFALFAGAPGNFKSQMVEILCADLQIRTLTAEQLEEAKVDHFRYVFKREQSNVYWDGFKDPHIVIFDDIGQFKTCVQNIDNEFADVLKGVNELPLPLHMAAVDAKGATYFKARFIIGTTNFTNPAMENINSREAYNRRVALAFYQVPKREFCTEETKNAEPMMRKLDKKNKSLPRGELGEILTHPENHSEFIRYNPHDPSEQLGTFTYSEVVELIMEEYYTRERFFNQKNAEVTAIWNKTNVRKCFIGSDDSDVESDDSRDYCNSAISMNSVEPQMGDLTSTACDFENLCRSIEVEQAFDEAPNYYIEDEIIGKAFIFMKREKINVSAKVDLIKKLHLRLFKKRAEGSDDLIWIKSCQALRSVQLLKYYSSAVSTHDFSKILRRNEEEFLVHYPDAWVGHPVLQRMPTDLLQKVWAEGYKTWTERIFSATHWAYEKVLNYYKENKAWLMPVLVMMSFSLAGQAVQAMTAYTPVDPTETMKDEDFIEEPIAGDSFISTNPLAPVREKTEKEEPQSYFYERGPVQGRNGRRRGHVGNKKQSAKFLSAEDDYGFQPEMAIDADPASYDLATRINGSCLLTLSLHHNGGDQRLGHLLVIADRVSVCPRHFREIMRLAHEKGTIKDDATVVISFRSTLRETLIPTYVPIQEFLDEKNWVFTEQLSSVDQALYLLPPDSARRYRSIITKVATIAQHNECKVRSGFLMGYSKDQNNLSTFQFEPIIGQPVSDPLMGDYYLGTAYAYYGNTGKGDCGTPLYAHNKGSPQAKIYGMHVAGTVATGRGIASVLVREWLEAAMETVPQCAKISTNVDDLELISELPFAQQQFMQAYESQYKVSEPGSTKIIPSELYGAWGPATTKPANLRPFTLDGQKIDVKANAYKKVCINDWKISQSVMKDVEDCYFADMQEVSKFEVEKRVYTFEESILGLENDPDFGGIARNTSPGFPYTQDPKVKRAGPGKRYWFGIEQEYDMDNWRVKALKKECNDIVENAKKGIRSEHIFTDCLKDERRPIAKVDAGKTRMINSGPFKLLIIMRQYFGAFSNFFMKNRIYNGSAIGVNPYSNEWDEIARCLKKFDDGQPSIDAGDYSGYDGSEKPVPHQAILNIINRWYDDSEENQLVRHVLWAEVVQSRHISGALIYIWPSSLPSGHPLTALINTIYNGLAFRYCWYRAVGMDKKLLFDFLRYVYVIMLGDDNTYCVHPDFRSVMNNNNLEGWMRQFGLDYTDETKTGTMTGARMLEEISFLKRKFRFDEHLHRYVAPLSLEVVLEIPYWTKIKDSTQITEDNAKLSVSELSLHGCEVYEKWAPKIVEAVKQNLGTNVRLEPFPVTLLRVVDSEWCF